MIVKEDYKNYKNKDWLEDQYINKKKKLREMAKECDVSIPTIVYWMDEFCIKRRTNSEVNSGKNNPNWNGGRIITKDGYIQIYKPDHPRATKNHAHISEHILVVEKTLGRFLKGEERVHHINHIKDDNRIENLFLCKNNSEHAKVDKTLINIGIELALVEFKRGNIVFNRKKGEYNLLGDRGL